MRRIADGEAYTTPATIDDPAILDEMGEALRTIGYAQPTEDPVPTT
jgi:propionyl-CoA synthetase